MDETRIDNLESQFAELRAGQRAIEGRLCRLEAGLEQTATREAVAIVRAGLDQTATKADLKDLRTELYRAISDLRTWVIGTSIAIIGIVLAAAFGLHHWSG